MSMGVAGLLLAQTIQKKFTAEVCSKALVVCSLLG